MNQEEQWWALLAAMFVLQLVSLALAWWAAQRAKRLAHELEIEVSDRRYGSGEQLKLLRESRYDIDGLADHLKLQRTKAPASRWEPKL